MDDLHQLRKDVDTISYDVKSIKNALLGTEYSESKGIVHSQMDHELRIAAIEQKMNSGKWLLIGLSFGAGLGVTSIVDLVLQFVRK